MALAQANPSALNIDDLLRIFSSSASAFEQYDSLRALDAIAPILGTGDRARAVSVLGRGKADPRGLGVMRDPYIPSWINRVVEELRDEASS